MKTICILFCALLILSCSARQGERVASSPDTPTALATDEAPAATDEAPAATDDRPTAAATEEEPLASASEIWPAIRVGTFVYAMMRSLESEGERSLPSGDMEDLGRAVRDGDEEPMQFFGLDEEPPDPLVVTVLTPDAPPFVTKVRRRLTLAGSCEDPRGRGDDWHERWVALEIDHHTASHESIVVPGAHPSATLSPADFDDLEVTISDVGEQEPPDHGVFLRGSQIALIPSPVYPEHTHHLQAAGVSYFITLWGAHGYGRAVFSIEPGPPRNARTFFYPAVTCGAY